MTINRIIYGYKYETELTTRELKEARAEYATYLEYQALYKQLECYSSFKNLSSSQQKKIAQTIDLQIKDLAAVLNISTEEAANSLIPAVMFSLESFVGGSYDLHNKYPPK